MRRVCSLIESAEIALVAVAVAVAAGCGGGGGNGGNDGGGGTGMITIAAGTFLMGCNDAVDGDCSADERPSHQVSLSAFEIDATEVTRGAYKACVDAGSCPATADFDTSSAGAADLPVTSVSWDTARAYCQFAGKTLPTEAQWEKAARGGDGRKYPWGNAAPTCALTNMGGCGNSAVAVGSHPTGASPSGALDMAGNVMEWVADWYGDSYYASSPAADPVGPATGTQRIYRGGGFLGGPLPLRTSGRYATAPDSPLNYGGFRCAR